MCLQACSAVAEGHGHRGYVIPFKHMLMPFKALSPGTQCLQDSWVFMNLPSVQWE